MKKILKKVTSVVFVVALIISVMIIPCYAAPSKGDVNSDGKITAADARLVLRVAARLEEFTTEQMNAADVEGEDNITAADARKILRVAAKLEDESSLSPELPIIPPHFDLLSAAFGSTFGAEFDYKTNDANYIVFNMITNDFIPLGYFYYSDDFKGFENLYSDPQGKFRYCFGYSEEVLKYICEEIYNVEYSLNNANTEYSYISDGYLYRECCGPTGLEETYSAIIKNYKIDASGAYNMNVYYVCEYPGGMDIIGEYNIVADWVADNGGYWSFYSVNKI